MLEEAGERSEDRNEGCIGGVEEENMDEFPRLEAAFCEVDKSSNCSL